MARYKDVDTQPRFLPIDLGRQLQPGTFEHALNHLLDHELDLSRFDARFGNDATGASAYPPALLLKRPINTSTAPSGTRADAGPQPTHLEAAVQGRLARHREQDQRATGPYADAIIVSGLPGHVPDAEPSGKTLVVMADPGV
jgi:hypothetical protein